MKANGLTKELTEYAMNVKSERPDWSLKQCVNHVVNFHQSRIGSALGQEARDHVQNRIPKENFIDLVQNYTNDHGMKVAEATRQAANDRPDLYQQYDQEVKNRGKISLTELSGRIDLAVKEYMRENDIDDYATALRQVLQEHH